MHDNKFLVFYKTFKVTNYTEINNNCLRNKTWNIDDWTEYKLLEKQDEVHFVFIDYVYNIIILFVRINLKKIFLSNLSTLIEWDLWILVFLSLSA